MYEFRNLDGVSIGDMVDAWNLAFSDYLVPVNMTPDKLRAYFKVTGVDPGMSFGVFARDADDALVGMLINSIDTYNGRLAAYDAMTGIAPEHRGKGLFSQLYEHTRSSMKKHGISHYYLEVISTNERACSIYRKKGGRVVRELAFLTGKMGNDVNGKMFDGFGNSFGAGVVVSPLSSFPVEDLSRYEPSFGCRVSSLHRNVGNYQVAYIEDGGRKTAAVFSNGGDVPQILFGGLNDRGLLRAVFAYLSQEFDNLRILNIPSSEQELIAELVDIGFDNSINQYEMCIEL